MILIIEEDKVLFENLSLKSKLDMSDKVIMRNLCEKYFQRGCAYCLSCDTIVRNEYNKLITFYNKNKDN